MYISPLWIYFLLCRNIEQLRLECGFLTLGFEKFKNKVFRLKNSEKTYTYLMNTHTKSSKKMMSILHSYIFL